jgi:hypothetical protein
MKGKLHKTIKGEWVVRIISEETPECNTIIEHGKQLPVHPEYVKYYFLDEDAEGGEVEFDWCVIVDHDSGKGKEYAKLLHKKSEYPELDGTNELCNDKIWDDIYHDYTAEQYPAFGGPFTDSISFIDWLKLYYKAPQTKIK